VKKTAVQTSERCVATRLCRLAFLLTLAAGLSGCGFHLRSYNINTAISSVHVSSNGANVAAEPLRLGLQQAGVEISPTEADSEVSVQLLKQRRDQRSVSVTENAREAESELSLGVQYSITGAEGKVLITPRWVETTRIFRVDRANLVGNSDEQAMLEREMVNDLVQQIVRSLDAATREMSVAG